jgi:cytochrome c oxidase cbb3-type subunit IV
MLKFIKGNLTSLDGVSIYPIISLLIFFTFFVMLGIWALKVRKTYIDEMSAMPLDKD